MLKNKSPLNLYKSQSLLSDHLRRNRQKLHGNIHVSFLLEINLKFI